MSKMSSLRLESMSKENGLELLRTKLNPPRLRGPLVSREELFARLDESQEGRVTLLSAPAGFGKTTLIRSWLANRPDCAPVAWVSLDKGDDDPVRFWRYILTACQCFSPGVGQQSLDLLAGSHQPTFENALILFINELAQYTGRGLLVLEDYHRISSPRVHETLTFFVDYLPETLHLVLITRSDPPLPLARWRAHDDLYELRVPDLRFSLDEMHTFLHQALAYSLNREDIARLNERTEGWAAGLRLLTLALQGRQTASEIEQVLATFTGSHQHIQEYLVADVLSVQPSHLQDFLLQTSLLGHVNGSLCDAVTGRNDSVQMLARLDSANLFLYRLEGHGQWYRYHALFAEAMQHEARKRFHEESVRELYARASLWYEEHDVLIDAIESALLSQNFPRAAELLERYIGLPNYQNEYYTIHRWLGQLPESELRRHPSLCLVYATTLLFLTDRYSAETLVAMERPLQIAERVWQKEERIDRLGEVEALRSTAFWWQGDFAQSFRRARQALELLPANAWMWRGVCLVGVAASELYDGRADSARRLSLEARKANEAAGNKYGQRASLFMTCETYLVQGELHLAAQLYHRILVDAEADKDFSDSGAVFPRLAALSYEWNDLTTAENWINRSLELDQHFLDDDALVRNSLVRARIRHARGEGLMADQDLTALAARVQRWPHLLREIYICLARFALAAGDASAANQHIAMLRQYSSPSPYIYEEQGALLNSRLLIVQGESAEALRLLQHWYSEAQERRRMHSMLEILILQALAHASRRENPQACHLIKQALLLARPEGYQRLFLDEGEPLVSLLRVALSGISEEQQSAYVRTLLLAHARKPAAGLSAIQVATSQQGILIEPLSPQEQRVLRLLAAGCSNPEIARELVVSVNTIKTQVQSIYHKLNVNSRQEAREAARRLRLL